MEPRNTRPTAVYTVLIIVLAVLLLAACFLLWRLFFAPSAPPESLENPPGETEADTPPEPDEPDAPEEPDTPEQFPDDASANQAEPHIFGSLRLFYDGDTLKSETDEDKTHVALCAGGKELPRLDAQVLDGPGLGEEQRVRLAAGLLQAYYADPPATEAVPVEPDPAVELGYRLETAALGETPAMSARVRFLSAGAKLWCVVLLCPADETPGQALTAAFESAEIIS